MILVFVKRNSRCHAVKVQYFDQPGNCFPKSTGDFWGSKRLRGKKLVDGRNATQTCLRGQAHKHMTSIYIYTYFIRTNEYLCIKYELLYRIILVNIISYTILHTISIHLHLRKQNEHVYVIYVHGLSFTKPPFFDPSTGRSVTPPEKHDFPASVAALVPIKAVSRKDDWMETSGWTWWMVGFENCY